MEAGLSFGDKNAEEYQVKRTEVYEAMDDWVRVSLGKVEGKVRTKDSKYAYPQDLKKR